MTTADRIRTTHIGSLPRPPELVELLERIQGGESVDESELSARVAEATRRVVERQQSVGIDVGNNGEQPRVGFNFYVADRLDGFDGESEGPIWGDLADYPSYAERAFESVGMELGTRPAATGPITYTGEAAARAELEAFGDALAAADGRFSDTFVTTASPGVIATSLGNQYYDSHEEFVFALGDAMAQEYELLAAETDATLQLDAPDLLGERHRALRDRSEAEFLEVVRTHVAALNEAVSELPAERLRLHTCWGNYEGPHHLDVPLERVLPEIYEADVGGLCIEQANPRHHHERRAFEEHQLPGDWTLLPGVIDTKTNVIEPPAVVADRLERFAEVVGDPGRVLAAPDCGFGTVAGLRTVDPEIAWAKLESMAEGARLASERLR